ncbi:MAG: FHA domain-containing protein [Chloroflexota bacterium]
MKYTEENKIVTLFNRKKIRPRIDKTQRLSSGDVPEIVHFMLPDGTEYPVDVTKDVTVGRVPSDDDPAVTIDLEPYDGHDLGVSRQHAMLKRIKDNLVLVDLGSSNGTFVNGHKAEAGERYNIMDGDTLTFSRLTLEVRFIKRNHR